MRVVIASTVFAPAIGGIEMAAGLLARELQKAGHEVTVLTNTPPGDCEEAAVPVIRRPSPLAILRCYWKSDAVLLMGVTLRLGWPFLFVGRPAVISHQGYAPAQGAITQAGCLRRTLVRRARHIACSRSVAQTLGYPCEHYGSPYDDAVFVADGNAVRDRELAFVGRLVPEKGPDVLLDAVASLAAQGITPHLTIVGEGPMRPSLERRAHALGLGARTEFAGRIVGVSLAALLNRHQILVVPSSWDEPFGLVALEAIACGCVVVGTSGGGLPEAIGSCGVLFPNGNALALAAVLSDLLADPGKQQRLASHADVHLRPYRPAKVVRRYIELMSDKHNNTRGGPSHE